MAKYRKAITAIVGAAVLIASHFLGADSVWVLSIVSVATALGVYQIPNA